MTSFLKAGALALAASLVALPALAASTPHAASHHHKAHHAKMHHARSHHAHMAHVKLHHAKAHHRVAGKIERINAKHNTLTINHRVYRLAPHLASTSFKPGQKVQIEYKKGRGHRLVEKIT